MDEYTSSIQSFSNETLLELIRNLHDDCQEGVGGRYTCDRYMFTKAVALYFARTGMLVFEKDGDLYISIEHVLAHQDKTRN